MSMNKFLCFLTGGHRYADTGIEAKQQSNPNWFLLSNKCIKCGKVTSVECNIGAIIRADIAKMKGTNKNEGGITMATCKECLHHDACLTILKLTFPNIQEKEIEQARTRENDCRNFKPAADVAEVVRCKDCKHCERGICYYPKVRYVSHDKNHFCSYGERKEE